MVYKCENLQYATRQRLWFILQSHRKSSAWVVIPNASQSQCTSQLNLSFTFQVCRVSTLQGDVKEYSKYQVLENVEGSGRLTWMAWNKLSNIAAGAVVGGKDLLVARRTFKESPSIMEPGLSHFMGVLDTTEGLGKISVLNQVGFRLRTLL